MTHRVIQGLKWAQPVPRPQSIPSTTPQGVRALGVVYENKLAKALPQARHGQWFEFEDKNGHGYCCTDLLLKHGEALLVLEAKLTDCLAGQTQLTMLYIPVVQFCTPKRVVGVEVVKNLRSGSQTWRLIQSLPEALTVGYPEPPLFQWRGEKIKV